MVALHAVAMSKVIRTGMRRIESSSVLTAQLAVRLTGHPAAELARMGNGD
jgi:hypothetical protein